LITLVKLHVEARETFHYAPAAVRMAFRFLVCLVVASSIALAAVPRQPAPAAGGRTDCCATMTGPSATHECERHAPKPEPDAQCCALCAMGCALLVTLAAPFVYPPVGDETFPAYICSEPSRSQRPPVPPPRA